MYRSVERTLYQKTCGNDPLVIHSYWLFKKYLFDDNVVLGLCMAVLQASWCSLVGFTWLPWYYKETYGLGNSKGN